MSTVGKIRPGVEVIAPGKLRGLVVLVPTHHTSHAVVEFPDGTRRQYRRSVLRAAS